MCMKTVAEYRKFAEDCRELAAKLTTADDKHAQELMATAWENAANQREAQLGNAAARRFSLPIRLATAFIMGVLAAAIIVILFRGVWL
jgi:hypothetical protein